MLLEYIKTWTMDSQCLKITEKVSFNISSEAFYNLSGQKCIKDAQNGQFWRVFAVKQCYQAGHF